MDNNLDILGLKRRRIDENPIEKKSEKCNILTILNDTENEEISNFSSLGLESLCDLTRKICFFGSKCSANLQNNIMPNLNSLKLKLKRLEFVLELALNSCCDLNITNSLDISKFGWIVDKQQVKYDWGFNIKEHALKKRPVPGQIKCRCKLYCGVKTNSCKSCVVAKRACTKNCSCMKAKLAKTPLILIQMTIQKVILMILMTMMILFVDLLCPNRCLMILIWIRFRYLNFGLGKFILFLKI